MDSSIWKDLKLNDDIRQLDGDISCDVLVVGGGMAGLLAAYMLQTAGRQVVLVEADRVCRGITGGTTAVITAQHDELYKDLAKKYGAAKARDYLRANLLAVEKFKQLVADEKIDCDFEVLPSCVYSREVDMTDEVQTLKRLGFAARLVREIELPFEVKSGVVFDGMAQFHPLKFAYALAQKLQIYEHCRVDDIDDNYANVSGKKIKFRQCVVATHFPFLDRHGLFFAKMYQKRSYVMALEGAGELHSSYIDDQEQGFYFRQYRQLLLVGKGEHRTAMKTDAINELYEFKQKFYPSAKVVRLWANQDCVTLDDMPYIGAYGKAKNLFVTTGFNLWGMTGSMVGAMILCDIMCGKANEFAATFDANRRMLRWRLLGNVAAAILGMIYPSVKRCPHLGCALMYNKLEHTWDCPCHGSRFDEGGEVIDNPANKSAKTLQKSGVKQKNSR